MKSVLWNERRMVTKCVTPFDRLIRINPELVLWCPLNMLSSIFQFFRCKEPPARLWSNLIFVYKNDFLVHVAVCLIAWLFHDSEREFSFFFLCCLYLIFTKGGWNSDSKICGACSSGTVVHMKLCMSFFKVSYLVDAACLEFDLIFFYQFFENAWVGSEII